LSQADPENGQHVSWLYFPAALLDTVPAVRMIYLGGAYFKSDNFCFTLHQKSTGIVHCSSLGTLFQVSGRFKIFPPECCFLGTFQQYYFR
jgi:hypothetical protein